MIASTKTQVGEPKHSPLGKKSNYKTKYDRKLLFQVPRICKRKDLGIYKDLPFFGEDIWNAYELSWLNLKGKPQVAVAEIRVPATSPFLIESKSLKLYLNSFNNTRLTSLGEFASIVKRDLCEKTSSNVELNLFSPQDFAPSLAANFEGTCIDGYDLDFDSYQPNPKFLQTSSVFCHEKLYSNLLKSNCLVTAQPDWASIQVAYEGPKIDHEGLLRYLVSFRNHSEFHEQCVERIFLDIFSRCSPRTLSVYARYTRRGGLDINPFRSSEKNLTPQNLRLFRQ